MTDVQEYLDYKVTKIIIFNSTQVLHQIFFLFQVQEQLRTHHEQVSYLLQGIHLQKPFNSAYENAYM